MPVTPGIILRWPTLIAIGITFIAVILYLLLCPGYYKPQVNDSLQDSNQRGSFFDPRKITQEIPKAQRETEISVENIDNCPSRKDSTTTYGTFEANRVLCTISGRVLDCNGVPLPNAAINVSTLEEYLPYLFQNFTVLSGDSGSFKLACPFINTGDRVSLHAVHPGNIELDSFTQIILNPHEVHIDLLIPNEPQYDIVGCIKGQWNWISDIPLRFICFPTDGSRFIKKEVFTRTNRLGSFTVKGLPRGSIINLELDVGDETIFPILATIQFNENNQNRRLDMDLFPQAFDLKVVLNPWSNQSVRFHLESLDYDYPKAERKYSILAENEHQCQIIFMVGGKFRLTTEAEGYGKDVRTIRTGGGLEMNVNKEVVQLYQESRIVCRANLSEEEKYLTRGLIVTIVDSAGNIYCWGELSPDGTFKADGINKGKYELVLNYQTSELFRTTVSIMENETLDVYIPEIKWEDGK